MNERDDGFADLMTRACRDENQALAALIALYEPEVLRAARVLVGRSMRSSLDPADLAQSVHLQFIHGLKQKKFVIKSPEQLRALAVTLLRNKFIQQWRRHRCEARHHTALATASERMRGKEVPAVRDLDPVRLAEYLDSLEHLFRLLRSEDRLLVTMRIQGYRTREIAAELGIELAAVRVRLSRLRHRLRRETSLTEWQ